MRKRATTRPRCCSRRPATAGPQTVEQTDEETLKGEDRQWTLVLELGAMF